MPKKRKLWQTKLEYYAARGVIEAIGRLPLEKSMSAGAAFGEFLQKFAGKLNHVAYKNLEIAFPNMSENEKQLIVRGCFASLGRQLGLFSHFRRVKAEEILKILEIEGYDHFVHAKETGHGILFFTGHFGSWEIFGLVPPALGHQMNLLVRRIDNPLVENFVEDLRTSFGTRTIDKKTSARTMFRLLQNGALLGLMADLNVQEREGIFVDFFGVPASTTTGLAKLALRTDAIVLPAFAIWNKEKQKYLLKVEPPLDFEKTGDDSRDVYDLTQKATKVIEKFVRLYPEQWMWIHKRWNTRPVGESKVY